MNHVHNRGLETHAGKTSPMSATITITLTPKQEAQLAALVAAGDFSSIEEAARKRLARALDLENEGDEDLSWMKPYIAEGEASGDPLSHEEFTARRQALLAQLGLA